MATNVGPAVVTFKGQKINAQDVRIEIDKEGDGRAVVMIGDVSTATFPLTYEPGAYQRLVKQLERAEKKMRKAEAKKERQPKLQPVRRGPSVGRNEPCTCGSGRKAKRCCLR